MTSAEQATIIIGGAALVIENIPNMVEAALKIQRLLQEQGVEARVVAVNQQAITASNDALRVIEEYRAAHGDT